MEITAIASQTVVSGDNVLFSETPVLGNCSIIHREGSGLVTLRGLTHQCRARFKVSFNGNISQTAGTLAPLTAAIALNGEAISSTVMSAVPAALNDIWNIASSVYIDVPAGCCATVSVKNTSAAASTVAFVNSNLIVERVA